MPNPHEDLSQALYMICYLCKRLNPQHTGNPDTCDCNDVAFLRKAISKDNSNCMPNITDVLDAVHGGVGSGIAYVQSKLPALTRPPQEEKPRTGIGSDAEEIERAGKDPSDLINPPTEPPTEKRWIPVTEQFPWDGVAVIVTDGRYVGLAWRWYATKKWGPVEPGSINWNNCVTHWMPLPEPPVEENAP